MWSQKGPFCAVPGSAVALQGSKKPILPPQPPGELALSSGPPGGGLWSRSPLPAPRSLTLCPYLAPAQILSTFPPPSTRSSPSLASGLGPSCHPPRDILTSFPTCRRLVPLATLVFSQKMRLGSEAVFLWEAISPPLLSCGSRHVHRCSKLPSHLCPASLPHCCPGCGGGRPAPRLVFCGTVRGVGAAFCVT